MNLLNLKGRSAVITGGARGIGFAIAKRLMASGAKISLWDRDEKGLSYAAHSLPQAHTVTFDASVEAQVHNALDLTLEHLGKIDILVCSAGISGPNATVADYPLDAWKQVMDINLTGLFLCNKVVVPHMQSNGFGRIVNIASVAGKEGSPNGSAYAASKAGVIALTKSLGHELARSKIRVNCVTPSAIKTALFDQMKDDHIDYTLSKIPLGRFGEVEEVAAMVAWLCTDECSFSTGAVFDVSGGRAVY